MQPEEREMLKKALELSQENNKMLHSIKRHLLIGRIFRIVYWVVIIGAAIGLYYYIEPYLESLKTAYDSVKMDFQGIGDLFKSN